MINRDCFAVGAPERDVFTKTKENHLGLGFYNNRNNRAQGSKKNTGPVSCKIKNSNNDNTSTVNEIYGYYDMNIYLLLNWKMNNTLSQAFALLEKYVGLLETTSPELIFSVFPPFPYLFPMFESISSINDSVRFARAKVKFGAQNVFHEPFGSYTGEVSPSMLTEVCEYVMVGHSERRTHFNENDSSINKKIHLIMNNSLTPVLCVGEDQDTYNSGQVDEFIELQIKSACENIKNIPANRFIVAYEPTWAIGSGITPTSEIINRRALLIKNVITDMGLMTDNASCPVLYGGSVNSINAKSFLELDNVDGLLIGQASLDLNQIGSIINQAAQLVKNNSK